MRNLSHSKGGKGETEEKEKKVEESQKRLMGIIKERKIKSRRRKNLLLIRESVKPIIILSC